MLWSVAALKTANRSGGASINAIIAAEIAPQFDSAVQLQGYVSDFKLDLLSINWDAAHRAGMAHSRYRQRGGLRTMILADFFIGAHASALGATVLTRDPKRYSSYFPSLTLISPETHP